MAQASSNSEPAGRKPTVVGIGASAGGLAALRAFFEHVPADSELAFVVVVHLSPEHKSHLADVLQPHVRLPVRQVSDTTLIEPGNVYVIPPNANLEAIDTHLRLSQLEEKRRERAPIDHFFRTLASTHDGDSVGVILSGTGSDGTLGIRDIKASSGLILVQDPKDAEYDGMPQSAISTGMVDRILPVREIPEAILRFCRTEPRIPLSPAEEEAPPTEQILVTKLLAVLRARTDRDFTRYKRSTILRRVARRMQLNYIEDLGTYLEKIWEWPEEARALADDLLITVTSFFRDPDVFKLLEEKVVPRMFDSKGPHDTLRVWSVGCATGEEAFSLAMVLLEEAGRRSDEVGRRELPPQIQVFASDLHKSSLEKAREGFYPADIEIDVGEDRLERFFTKVSGGYRIKKEVRDRVVFAPHDLLADPPFSRLDLISCRNLLIYMERDLQRDVIELFHYSLNPDGNLLLGSAETMDGSDLFRAEDKKLCFFRKRNVPPPEPRLPVFPLPRTRKLDDGAQGKGRSPETVVYGTVHQRMVERYAPPSVLVNADNKVVHISEHAGRYLVHPGGELVAGVLKLVREELRIELQVLLQTARDKREPVDSQPITVRFDGESRPVLMHVRPALDPDDDGFSLIIFEEREPRQTEGETPAANGTAAAGASVQRVRDLESELSQARQRLQAFIEEYESSQEEMKASNEEMQSTNEELRSTMEELETSKEELQSINEELQTVNQENRHKVDELSQLSGDLQNLLAATDIATLFLDRDLRILRFTPKVGELFNVRVADRGRPISDLTHRLGYNELLSDGEAVLSRLIPIEREVQDEAGRWYLTRVLPYRSTEDRIEGIVITFVDITVRKNSEVALRASEERLSVELGSMQRLHSLVARLLVSQDLSAALKDILDSSLDITGADKGNVQLLDVSSGTLAIVSQRGFDQSFLDHFRVVSMDTDSACGRALRSKKRVVIEDVETDPRYVQHRAIAAEAGYRAVQSTPLISRSGQVLGILSTHTAKPYIPTERDLRILDLYTRLAADFVERTRADEELRNSEERYRLLIENAREYAIFLLDPKGNIATWNSGAEHLFGYTREEIVGLSGSVLYTSDDRAAGVPETEMKAVAETGRYSMDGWQVAKDGARFWASGVTEALRSKGGTLAGFVKVLRDNTERRAAEERLQAQGRELRSINTHLLSANADLKQFAYAASHDLREPLRMIATYSEFLIDAYRQGRGQEAEQAVQFILAGTGRMERLLGDLLSYTRVTLEGDASQEPVDLNLVMNEVLSNESALLEETRARITRTDLPTVTGRKGHFVQLFQNLVSNAIKYRAERPLEITITAERIGADWRIAVIDNGLGIDPQFHEQIFGVFKRLHGNEIAGTGIGLAICKRVVERCGGRIWVESQVDQGATVYFTLPVPNEARAD